MHQREGGDLIPGPVHTAALRSAALLTLALGLDQDPGLTLFPQVDHAPVHAPMAGLIPVPPILDEMDAVTDAPGQGPAPVPGLTATGAPGHHTRRLLTVH